MNIEIESSGDIGMTEYHAHSLIVASAFNAAGGEGMAQAMKYNPRYAKTFEQPREIITISARVDSNFIIAHYEIVFSGLFNDAQGFIKQ